MGHANKLTEKSIKNELTKPGTYADGGNLYLCVKASTAKQPTDGPTIGVLEPNRSWLFRYMLNGSARSIGLGPWPAVPLKQARAKAASLHVELAEARDARPGHAPGPDPLAAKRAMQAERKRLSLPVPVASVMTFDKASAEFIAANESRWRSQKHGAQWSATLKQYASEAIGGMDVNKISKANIAEILEPIWAKKHETASRLRGRIEAILNWSIAHGHREEAKLNPARWKGCLDNMLPKHDRSEQGHHAAMAYENVPAFWKELVKADGVAAKAVQFAILTAARSGEVRKSVWAEINLEKSIWTIPGARMKGKRIHRVPLSDAALLVLEDAAKLRQSDLVFNGQRTKSPLSDMSLAAVLKRMKFAGVTVHGFRSSFRDWCAERTSYPSEVAEIALAHSIGTKVEKAYQRRDMFAKRHALVVEWAAFVTGMKPDAMRKELAKVEARYVGQDQLEAVADEAA
jgi:integrase